MIDDNKMREFLSLSVEPIISKAIDFAIYSLSGNSKSEFLSMEQESIADNMISVAHKRYMLRTYNNGKIKHKITGLPMIDKTTPEFSKKKLFESLDLLFDENISGLNAFIDETKKEFVKQPLKSICSNKSVNCLDYVKASNGKLVHSITKSACPFQSRGSINFNLLIDKGIIFDKKIVPGEKVYMLYLKVPNNITYDNALCVRDFRSLHKDINKYVDYDTLFEKNFIKKLQIMGDIIKYDYSKRNVLLLDDWM